MSKLSWRAKLMALFTLILGASVLFQLLYVVPYIKDRKVEMTAGFDNPAGAGEIPSPCFDVL